MPGEFPFLGEYAHALDEKGRVILPARFRERLAEGAFVTREVDGCLAVRTPEEFTVRAAEMGEKWRGDPDERNVARVFFAGAHEAAPDRQGRLAIPQHLREYAGLERDVALIGAFHHIEIWDAERWKEKKQAGVEGMQTGGQPTHP